MDADDPRRELPNTSPTTFDAAISNGRAIEGVAEAVRLMLSCLERKGIALDEKETIVGLLDSAVRMAVREVEA